MIKLINRITRRRFWYSVRFIYKNKDGSRVFDFVNEVGLTQKHLILKYRTIKKIMKPLHQINSIPKYMLRNGSFTMEVQCYLGWFKK